MIKGVRTILAIILIFLPKEKRGKFLNRIDENIMKTDTITHQIISGVVLCIIGLFLLFLVCITILKLSGEV